MKSIKKQLEQVKFKEAEIHKSAGILDDYSSRKVVTTREGSVTKVPVNDSDMANKKYVDDAIAAGGGHTRLHAVDGTSDHSLGSGTSGKLVQFDTTNILKNATNTDAEVAGAVTHAADNTQAHSDYLLNSGTDEAVGPLTTTADVTLSGAAFIPNVCFGTAANPGAASGYSQGSIYFKYTP